MMSARICFHARAYLAVQALGSSVGTTVLLVGTETVESAPYRYLTSGHWHINDNNSFLPE